MTAPELKPCPFCGGKAVTEILIVEGVVFCSGCRATIIRKHEAKEDTGQDNAIAAWNRRADLAAVQPAQVQPDPRDEVIKGLVEAATDAAEAIDMAYGSDDDESPHRHSAKLRAALAAAKAVQHD